MTLLKCQELFVFSCAWIFMDCLWNPPWIRNIKVYTYYIPEHKCTTALSAPVPLFLTSQPASPRASLSPLLPHSLLSSLYYFCFFIQEAFIFSHSYYKGACSICGTAQCMKIQVIHNIDNQTPPYHLNFLSIATTFHANTPLWSLETFNYNISLHVF